MDRSFLWECLTPWIVTAMVELTMGLSFSEILHRSLNHLIPMDTLLWQNTTNRRMGVMMMALSIAVMRSMVACGCGWMQITMVSPNPTNYTRWLNWE